MTASPITQRTTSAPHPEASEPLPRWFGPFVLVRRLGKGGSADVYLARTPWEQQPLVALKILRKDAADQPLYVAGFRNESALALRLVHPNVVRTLDVGAVDGQPYLASHYLMGRTIGRIAGRLRRDGRMCPPRIAMRVMLDALRALAYFHRASGPDGEPAALLHRDVSPGNLVVCFDGRVRLVDFGLASRMSEPQSCGGLVVGTLGYIAPEIARGEPAHPAADLYGLGAVLSRLLTGAPPVDGTGACAADRTIGPLPSLVSGRPDLPPWLVALIARLVDPDPSARPRCAAALFEEAHRGARARGLLASRRELAGWLSELFVGEAAHETSEATAVSACTAEDLASTPPATASWVRSLVPAPLVAPSPRQRAEPHTTSMRAEPEITTTAIRVSTPPSSPAADDEVTPCVVARINDPASARPRPMSEPARWPQLFRGFRGAKAPSHAGPMLWMLLVGFVLGILTATAIAAHGELGHGGPELVRSCKVHRTTGAG